MEGRDHDARRSAIECSSKSLGSSLSLLEDYKDDGRIAASTGSGLGSFQRSRSSSSSMNQRLTSRSGSQPGFGDELSAKADSSKSFSSSMSLLEGYNDEGRIAANASTLPGSGSFQRSRSSNSSMNQRSTSRSRSQPGFGSEMSAKAGSSKSFSSSLSLIESEAERSSQTSGAARHRGRRSKSFHQPYSRSDIFASSSADLSQPWPAPVNSMGKRTKSSGHLGRKLMNWGHCQELCQQACRLLIGYTRVNNQSEVRSTS